MSPGRQIGADDDHAPAGSLIHPHRLLQQQGGEYPRQQRPEVQIAADRERRQPGQRPVPGQVPVHRRQPAEIQQVDPPQPRQAEALAARQLAGRERQQRHRADHRGVSYQRIDRVLAEQLLAVNAVDRPRYRGQQNERVARQRARLDEVVVAFRDHQRRPGRRDRQPRHRRRPQRLAQQRPGYQAHEDRRQADEDGRVRGVGVHYPVMLQQVIERHPEQRQKDEAGPVAPLHPLQPAPVQRHQDDRRHDVAVERRQRRRDLGQQQLGGHEGAGPDGDQREKLRMGQQQLPIRRHHAPDITS